MQYKIISILISDNPANWIVFVYLKLGADEPQAKNATIMPKCDFPWKEGKEVMKHKVE